MSKAVDELLLTEMREDDDAELMFSEEVEHTNQAIDNLMTEKSMAEHTDELFPPETKFIKESDDDDEELSDYERYIDGELGEDDFKNSEAEEDL